MSAKAKKVRYAVVALGHIAQVAVLPAFKGASRNSELAALVSGDPVKLRKLGQRYGVKGLFSYDQFEECLRSGEVDAVFIALPNHLHREFTVRAARCGAHVLCEKPLAVREAECREMIRACAANGVKLMTAYRLHFERANLEAMRAVESGRVGEPQIFHSSFSLQIREGDTRVRNATGGGTLYDIGVYCINAARNLFRAEPLEVFATGVGRTDRRFLETDAFTSAVLRFPDNRIATFATSFSSAFTAHFELLGSEGHLRLDHAYEYAGAKELTLTSKGKVLRRRFPATDQFAGEIAHFSDCILHGAAVESDGEEGLADVRIVEALYRSAATGRPQKVKVIEKKLRPSPGQVRSFPAARVPPLVNVVSPSL